MKKKIYFLTLFLGVFCLFSANAQTEWFGQGSIWYYTTPYSYGQSESCTKVELTGDTLIKGVTCKVLTFTDSETNKLFSKEYVHYGNDSVLYFNYYQDEFYVLYDFTANVGDTVVVHKKKFKPTDGFLCLDSIDNFKYIISEIDSIQISGTWLRRQKIKPFHDGSWGFSCSDYDTAAYIVEKLGNTGYFFGRSPSITLMESAGILRCYSDHTINYKNPKWNKECDFVNSLEENRTSDLQMYSDPSSSEIFFKSTNNTMIDLIEIIDGEGRSIKQMGVHDSKAKMNIRNLKCGYYLVKITFSNNNYLVRKFLKYN